jgi:hypothetical protein
MSRFSNVLLVMNACNLNKRVLDAQELMLLRRCVNGIKRLPNGRVGDDGYRAIKVAYVQQISHRRLSGAMSVLGQPGSAYNDCNWAQSGHLSQCLNKASPRDEAWFSLLCRHDDPLHSNNLNFCLSSAQSIRLLRTVEHCCSCSSAPI